MGHAEDDERGCYTGSTAVEEERLAALGRLMATVSHEPRDPLATVRGCVFLVAQALEDAPPAARRVLERAERKTFTLWSPRRRRGATRMACNHRRR